MKTATHLPFDMLGDIMGDHDDVDPQRVEPRVFARLAAAHSKERPGMPFSWMVSYDGAKALNNIRVFENGVRLCSLEFPIRVFFSRWSDAIVTSFVPLEAIREAHVLEWYSTFYEVPVDAAKAMLQQHPKWPYDGRNADLARAELIAAGGPNRLLKESQDRLSSMGIAIPRKWWSEADRDKLKA